MIGRLLLLMVFVASGPASAFDRKCSYVVSNQQELDAALQKAYRDGKEEEVFCLKAGKYKKFGAGSDTGRVLYLIGEGKDRVEIETVSMGGTEATWGGEVYTVDLVHVSGVRVLKSLWLGATKASLEDSDISIEFPFDAKIEAKEVSVRGNTFRDIRDIRKRRDPMKVIIPFQNSALLENNRFVSVDVYVSKIYGKDELFPVTVRNNEFEGARTHIHSTYSVFEKNRVKGGSVFSNGGVFVNNVFREGYGLVVNSYAIVKGNIFLDNKGALSLSGIVRGVVKNNWFYGNRIEHSSKPLPGHDVWASFITPGHNRENMLVVEGNYFGPDVELDTPKSKGFLVENPVDGKLIFRDNQKAPGYPDQKTMELIASQDYKDDLRDVFVKEKTTQTQVIRELDRELEGKDIRRGERGTQQGQEVQDRVLREVDRRVQQKVDETINRTINRALDGLFRR